jgi:MFS family permease
MGYGHLFAVAGPRLLLSGFFGRLPMAMIIVGILTVMAATRGSIADASIASAAAGLAAGIGGPILGAAADRWGQRWVLTVAALVNAAAMLVLVVAIQAQAPLALIVALSAAVGITVPQVSSLARARWVQLLTTDGSGRGGRGVSGAAMSYESMIDELTFVFGPALVGALATFVGPGSPLVAAAFITVAFVLIFAWHPSAVAPVAHSVRHVRGAQLQSLVSLGAIVSVLGMVAMGALFGSMLTASGEFMIARDSETQTGLVYGAMGVASAACAISVAFAPDRWALRWRWAVGAVILVMAAAALLAVDSIAGLVVVLLMLGVGVGVALVSLFSIGAVVAPPHRLTTMMTMLNGGIVVGQSLSLAVVGVVADVGGFSAAAVAVLVASALCLLFACVNLLLGRGHRSGKVMV